MKHVSWPYSWSRVVNTFFAHIVSSNPPHLEQKSDTFRFSSSLHTRSKLKTTCIIQWGLNSERVWNSDGRWGSVFEWSAIFFSLSCFYIWKKTIFLYKTTEARAAILKVWFSHGWPCENRTFYHSKTEFKKFSFQMLGIWAPAIPSFFSFDLASVQR